MTLLLDEQVHAGSDEEFVHVQRLLLNEAGVQNWSSLSFEFNPEFQELTVHEVKLRRGGQVFDQLRESRIQIIQQERELDRHLYDGRLSAVLFLEDVRVGDVIEYAYTVRGANPVFGGKYMGGFLVQWPTRVERQVQRLLVPEGRRIYFRAHGTEVTAQTNRLGDEIEYRWELSETRPLLPESEVATSYELYPWVQITEFESWSEVAKWAAPLYDAGQDLPRELQELVGQWRAEQADPQARAVQAVQFVQDQVRYLGIEVGPNSHRPSTPAEVHQRRFGDCKDKALLLCAILRALEIPADPVLVNSLSGPQLPGRLPSAQVFNHVVVRIRIGGLWCWVDPTMSFQRGGLKDRYFPDLGYGLVVSEESTDLVPLHGVRQGMPSTASTEVFQLNGRDDPAVLSVMTAYRGYDAEQLRASLATTSLDEMQNSYLSYYARLYPGTTVEAPIEVEDSDTEVLVRERYRIPEIWERSEGGRAAEFYPADLASAMAKPSIVTRRQPLGLRFPMDRSLRTVVKLPEDWTVKNDSKTIENEFFEFAFSATYTNRVLELAYRYRSRTNSVAPERMPEYLRALAAVEDEIGYSVTWADEEAVVSGIHSLPLTVCLLVFAGSAVVIGLAARAGVEAFPRLPPLPEVADGRDPRGLGGWLALVGFGMVMSLLLFLFNWKHLLPAIGETSWTALTNPGSEAYHPYYALLLVFELAVNIFMPLLLIATIVLFFAKKAVFPYFYIFWMLSLSLIYTVDHFGTLAIPGLSEEISPEDTRAVARAWLGCLIWVPYMLRSRRVRATFVN